MNVARKEFLATLKFKDLPKILIFRFIAETLAVYHGSRLDRPARSPLLPPKPFKKGAVLLLLERKRKRQSGAQTKSPLLQAGRGGAPGRRQAGTKHSSFSSLHSIKLSRENLFTLLFSRYTCTGQKQAKEGIPHMAPDILRNFCGVCTAASPRALTLLKE